MTNDAAEVTTPVVLAGGRRAVQTHEKRDAAVPAWWALLAGAVAVGSYLRATQLPSQILVDDEWHAVHALLRFDARTIATNFGTADYSIPLTLYDRFLALHGGLSEWQMHVPALAAGIALLVVAPWLLRDLVRLPSAAVWTALLALSPLLVYLSRTARPYALTCVLACVAVVAFRRAYREPRHARYAVLYAVTTFLAGWLHLVTLAFTLMPFAWYGVRALHARDRAALRRLVVLGFATLVPLILALAPPLWNASAQLAEKSGTDTVSVESVYRTALMMAGTASPFGLAVAIVLAAFGVRGMRARDADFVGYVLTLIGGSAVAIALARPAWIHHPGVYARYMLPALPFALLFVAEGTIVALARVRPRWLATSVAAAGVAAVFATGPIPGWLYRPNQFIGHARFQFDYDPAHNPYVLEIPKEPIPAFYRELAARPPASLTLIEAPWRLESNFDPFPWYQQVHRQYVKIGLVTPICGVRDFGEYPPDETRLRFRWFVHVARVLQGETFGARYLVMHRSAWKTPPDASIEWPDVDACLPRIEARLGAPVYRDDRIVVFDLAPGVRAKPNALER
ncbi:MAG TPA: hypothetical protein VFS06_18530 [Casimicrobiaceae bacterium]|nr:hypothetical protein [Casimicrobiaceae bacterium]